MITAPSGKSYVWPEPELVEEIATATQLSLQPFTRTPVTGGENWEDHILIVTDASLRQLTREWGKGRIDHRRFRANLVITLQEDVPYQEDEWLGKRLQIGEVILSVNSHCERCRAITMDPDHLAIDGSLLKTVVQTRQNRFGVYASVVQTGEIRSGDEVILLDAPVE